jgi:hypothetical protein
MRYMRAFHLGLLLLLFGAGVAAAQVQALSVTVNGNPGVLTGAYTYHLLRTSCENTSTQIPISWTAATSDSLFWSFDSTCSVPDGGGNSIPFQSNASSSGGIVDSATVFPRQILTSFAAPAGGDPCNETPPISGNVFVCVTQTVTNTFGGSTNLNWYMTLHYDTNFPPAPTSVVLTPGDADLAVDFGYDATSIPADHFRVFAQPDDAQTANSQGQCSPGADSGAGSSIATDPSGWPVQQDFSSSGQRIEGLTIGRCYDIEVQAFATDQTAGLISAPITGAPIEVLDYWRLYHLQGGQDQGGVHCQQAGGISMVALLVPLLWQLRRRRASG